jgi:hypothetical protein
VVVSGSGRDGFLWIVFGKDEPTPIGSWEAALLSDHVWFNRHEISEQVYLLFFLASEFALLDGHSTGRSLSLERAKLSIEPEIHVFSVTLGSWTEFERSLSIDV